MSKSTPERIEQWKSLVKTCEGVARDLKVHPALRDLNAGYADFYAGRIEGVKAK